MKRLPKPHNKYGYKKEEIISICNKLKLNIKTFWEAFGINTCMIDGRGRTIYYSVDVENALYRLGHKLGEYHLWD